MAIHDCLALEDVQRSNARAEEANELRSKIDAIVGGYLQYFNVNNYGSGQVVLEAPKDDKMKLKKLLKKVKGVLKKNGFTEFEDHEETDADKAYVGTYFSS